MSESEAVSVGHDSVRPGPSGDDAPSDAAAYEVVINDEEQYSIWPAEREIPAGWRSAGFRGLRAACLAHVDEVWTDMRPLSLRQWMADPPTEPGPDPLAGMTGPDLVERLTTGEQPVELVTAPGRETLDSAVRDGLVFLRFPQTDGPTELAVAVTDESGDGTGEFRGSLSLDWVALTLRARIDPTTLTGTAVLVRA